MITVWIPSDPQDLFEGSYLILKISLSLDNYKNGYFQILNIHFLNDKDKIQDLMACKFNYKIIYFIYLIQMSWWIDFLGIAWIIINMFLK